MAISEHFRIKEGGKVFRKNPHPECSGNSKPHFEEEAVVRKIVGAPEGSVSDIYRGNPGASLADQTSRYANFCNWADANGHNAVEYLLPQIHVPTEISPFLFEQRFARQERTPPGVDQIEALAPWDYQIEFGPVTTRPWRLMMEWGFHRYRASMLLGLAAEIAGEQRSRLSVLDVACHCGVFSLEFAERGFGSVRGLDIRPENIRQAQFLAETFHISNVGFELANARDLRSAAPADILFCGGLLYHVTFPMELFENIYGRTREFAIVDTLMQKHPFSGFHLVCSKDTGKSFEGETHYELMPTYRAVIDALHAVGFEEVYEVLGDKAAEVPFYQDHSVRSFVAVKNRSGLFGGFRAKIADSARPNDT
jgi:2-polyprenyl-3-methyl-5-hydroxy-6-metoxy-1,4-benzoquinol methylase